MARIKLENVEYKEQAVEFLVGKLIDLARAIDSEEGKIILEEKQKYIDAVKDIESGFRINTGPYNHIASQLITRGFTD